MIFSRSRFWLVALSLCLLAGSAWASPHFPELVGTTWEYAQTGATPDQYTIRIVGGEVMEGKDLLQFETSAGGDVLHVQLLAVTAKGVQMHGRRSPENETLTFDPPRLLVPAPLQVGSQWELDDEVAGVLMHQSFKVVAQEEVTVPAGVFQAYRLHCEQPWPLSISIDRWFVPGTGFVKESTTTRGPTGRLLSRVDTVLTKFYVAPPPEQPPASATITLAPPPPPSIKVEVTKERDGEPTTIFRSDAPNIFVHWKGTDLKLHSTVRVAWVVEDVGDVAEPGFIVDQSETEITVSDFEMRFTLGRPPDGWAAGKYRLEIYLDEVLQEKVDVLIAD